MTELCHTCGEETARFYGFCSSGCMWVMSERFKQLEIDEQNAKRKITV